MKNHFFLIYLLPPIILAVSEACFFWPKFFYAGLVISLILVFLAVKAITRKKIFSLDFFGLFFLSGFFLASSSVYALIVPEKFLVQLIFFLQFFFLFYFLKNISGEIRRIFLENASYWGNFLALFFFFSFLFGVKTFIGLPAIYSTFGFLLAVFLVAGENFWANKIALSDSLPFIFLITLIMAQFSWALYFLPLNHNVEGIILAICYYIVIGITKPFLRGSLTGRIIKFYLIGGLASITLLFLSAKWI